MTKNTSKRVATQKKKARTTPSPAKTKVSTTKVSATETAVVAVPKPKPKPTPQLRPIETATRLSGVIRLLQISLNVVRRNLKIFIGITLVYIILNILFVQGFANTDAASAKTAIDNLFGTASGGPKVVGALFTYMLGSSTAPSSDVGGLYQMIFLLAASMAFIWALREITAGRTKMRTRDAFYNGMTPLVPFLIVMVRIAIQMIPFIIGATIYSTVMSNGLAGSFGEEVIWAVVFALLAFWGLYMATPSVIALYIVTEPGMTPQRAIKAARARAHGRRLRLMGKVLFLPLGLMVLVGVIMIPVILIVTSAASWVLFLCVLAVLGIVHSYLFRLYQEVMA